MITSHRFSDEEVERALIEYYGLTCAQGDEIKLDVAPEGSEGKCQLLTIDHAPRNIRGSGFDDQPSPSA